ncbi:hypothetical protein RIF29_39850 [Crotalaria pallida]|uniref:Uncharacterized protein n=1 Tax=Crotalaria pallida TaxID=3830 RepID=A0AAN9E7F2_CROPI
MLQKKATLSRSEDHGADSQEVVNLVLNDPSMFHRYAAIILHITDMRILNCTSSVVPFTIEAAFASSKGLEFEGYEEISRSEC